MKILFVHNRYIEKGGEDAIVDAEIKLLKEHGHDVVVYEKENEYLKKLSFLKKVSFILFELSFSRTVYSEVKDIVRKEKPDIAHIHNIFFSITPSIYSALKEGGIPVVQSLHNFRLFCLGGAFFKNRAICEKCKEGHLFHAVIERCWKNSFLMSFFLAKVLYYKSSFLKNVDSYIVTSEFSRRKLIEFGLEEKKLYMKVNFLPTEPIGDTRDGNYALFAGRLVDYKGIETLMKAFGSNPGYKLKIIGDGPVREKVRSFASSRANVEWLGKMDRNSVFEIMRNASFVIFPSECYENMPLVIMESLAFSKPVLASNLGSIKEFVIDGVNGVLFGPGDAGLLADKIAYLFLHVKERLEMGKNANKIYRQKFDKEKNYQDLMNIYDRTINSKE